MIKQFLVLIAITSAGHLNCLGGPEAKNTDVVLFGTLTSHENNTFNITNISIGRSRDSNQKITLYEKPEKPIGAVTKINMTVNPFKDLTTTDLDLLKISKIEVPEPNTSWLWRKPTDNARTAPNSAYEFIEVVITWQDKQRMSYLLELGVENTTTPVKVFCDTIEQNPSTKTTDNPVFCVGIKKTDLVKKGAPFPAIKHLEIKGNCYELPNNATAVKK